MIRPSRFLLAASITLMIAGGHRANAALVAIPQTSFPTGSTAVSVSALAFGTQVNGLSIGGLTFGVSVNGVPTNSLMTVTSGPGVTNHLTDPAIVSSSNPAGLALTVNFAAEESYFGFGYALLSTGTIQSAVSIQLFENSTSLGSLSYVGVPDPGFPGGFAGVFSTTTSFNRAVLTFNSAAGAVAVNNFLYSSAVPEPSSAVLVVMGSASGLATFFLRRRRASPGQ